jgi:hypothetical protein
MAVLNGTLRDDPRLVHAWYLKGRFLNSIGFNRAAATMMGTALEKIVEVADRISLLEEQSFLWAECDQGAEALRAAEAAAALGSDSIRTHYLRGRALGLLGRLEECDAEMQWVLAVDPTNADALRATAMLADALKQTRRRRWWEFWK